MVVLKQLDYSLSVSIDFDSGRGENVELAVYLLNRAGRGGAGRGAGRLREAREDREGSGISKVNREKYMI